MNQEEREERSDKVIAGEYVLRPLPEDEREAFERRLKIEPELPGLVDEWERHFARLASELPPLQPPEAVWRGIERAIHARTVPAKEAQRPMWKNIVFWRLSAAAGIAAAVILAVFAASGPTAPTSDSVQNLREFVWVLTDGQKRPNFVIKFDQDRKRVTVIPLEAEAEAGKDMQLWLVPASGGGAPKSLGLLKPASVTTLSLDEKELGAPIDSGILAVSVEPPGGSTTGAPSGPVILQGKPTLVPAKP